MVDKNLSISEAAKYLEISVDTIRRWDKSGKLTAEKSEGGHRSYPLVTLELFKKDTFALATHWVIGPSEEPNRDFYCQNTSDFKGRLSKLQSALEKLPDLEEYFPLIVAVAGEIGNNSFDHNLGNWPNIPGIFFSFDTNKRQVALADRGQGVLRTLKRVRPSIKNDDEALRVAFTERISGRSAEARGNGLKFVLEVVSGKSMELYFYSGSAEAFIGNNNANLEINKTDIYYPGCLALIRF